MPVCGFEHPTCAVPNTLTIKPGPHDPEKGLGGCENELTNE